MLHFAICDDERTTLADLGREVEVWAKVAREKAARNGGAVQYYASGLLEQRSYRQSI